MYVAACTPKKIPVTGKHGGGGGILVGNFEKKRYQDPVL